MLVSFEEQARARCEACGGKLLEVNDEADHIHLLLELPPKVALADFVNALKTGTSRRLRHDCKDHLGRSYRKPVLWSRSSCILTGAGAPLEIIKQYIQQQARPENQAPLRAGR